MDFFIGMTGVIFEGIKHCVKNKDDFSTNFYANFFSDLFKSNHTEAFCYFINQKAESSISQKWIEKNPEKFKGFNTWRESK